MCLKLINIFWNVDLSIILTEIVKKSSQKSILIGQFLKW